MREIKFRAWSKEEGHWAHIDLDEWRHSVGPSASISNSHTPQLFELHSDEYFTWQQYTGLKDKNGVEIYEGDILAFYSTDGQRVTKRQIVKWEQSKLGFNFSQKPTVEVIGNTCENPGILELR